MGLSGFGVLESASFEVRGLNAEFLQLGLATRAGMFTVFALRLNPKPRPSLSVDLSTSSPQAL